MPHLPTYNRAREKGSDSMAIPYSRFFIGNLPWYSILIVTGIVIAFFIGMHEEKRLGLPTDTMIDATLVAVPCGIIGARVYYVAMEWKQFASNPLRILFIWEGGLAIYGGVIAGALAIFLFCRKQNISFGMLADVIAPGLVLAQAIGRWGNYFNMEAYGSAITNPQWMFFPAGVLISESGYAVWHMATFFYEFLWNLGVFVFLWLLRKSQQKQPGNVFLWYLLAYGSGRYLIEQLRMDSLFIGSLRVSQWLSLVLCVGAGFWLLQRACRYHKRITLVLTLCVLTAAILRWLLIVPWLYGCLLFFILILYMIIFSNAKPHIQNTDFHFCLFFLPWIIDVLTLVVTAYLMEGAWVLPIITSLTLPCYILILQNMLLPPIGRNGKPDEGEIKCPSES